VEINHGDRREGMSEGREGKTHEARGHGRAGQESLAERLGFGGVVASASASRLPPLASRLPLPFALVPFVRMMLAQQHVEMAPLLVGEPEKIASSESSNRPPYR
jgi:hypothetical protein